MRLRDEILSMRLAIIETALAVGARDIRVFGSVARGEERPDSDIDFLTENGLREPVRASALREAIRV